MAQTARVAEVTPRIDSLADCNHCGSGIVWDEVYGWLHTSGWYACRWSQGAPREVLSNPSSTRLRDFLNLIYWGE